jgi:hypothetical protein
MNYQDYIKYDPEKKQYTDSYGYVIDGYSSKALPSDQRAQQPAKANRVALIDTDSGVDPIVQAVGSDSINLILDAKGSVKTTKSLDVGSSNTNKYISIMGGGNTKITATQGTDADSDLTLESKGTGKLILTSQNTSSTQKESLDLSVHNGYSTFTASSVNTVSYPNSDIKFVPRGLGIVNCNSWTYDGISSTANPQTLPTGSNTRVYIDAATYNDFPAGFITFSGSPTNTFQNTSGRTITLMVSACIRESTTIAGRVMGLWIARSGDATIYYGQMLTQATGSDHNQVRALQTSSIIRLANSESFSVWASSNVTGVVIGGPNNWERTIISFRLMP